MKCKFRAGGHFYGGDVLVVDAFDPFKCLASKRPLHGTNPGEQRPGDTRQRDGVTVVDPFAFQLFPQIPRRN